MRTVRGAIAVLALCTLASCSQGSSVPPTASVRTPSDAVVTGGIAPCEGIPVPGGPKWAAGTVTVLRGHVTWRSIAPGEWQAVFPTDVAATSTVGVDQTYRFVLPAGYYVLRASYPPPGNAQPYTEISVRGGSAVSAGIPNMCM